MIKHLLLKHLGDDLLMALCIEIFSKQACRKYGRCQYSQLSSPDAGNFQMSESSKRFRLDLPVGSHDAQQACNCSEMSLLLGDCLIGYGEERHVPL